MPHFNDSVFTITTLVLPRLTVYTGGSNVPARSWSHLENLELTDPKFLFLDPGDILFGFDVFAAILMDYGKAIRENLLHKRQC